MHNEVAEGHVLAGKYRVERVLGRGGMGVVVAAHHIHLDERVAIKFLLPEAAGNAEALARFAREARAAVKIKSEHVARVSDVGTLAGGEPYMVMEYLEGGDLGDWLQKHRRLSMEQATEFLLQACEAIAEAHSLGIVHRDLKPANLFVIRTPSGALSVKVLDFGISKVTRWGGSAPDASMTKTSALMGSPLYMSPEQLQSPKDVDARSDIWALGVILYELLKGECPFGGETLPELVAKILSTAPTPLRALQPQLPAGLEAVIGKCLERDRNRRYASIGALASDLVEFAPREARISLTRITGIMRGSGAALPSAAPPVAAEPGSSVAGPSERVARTAAGTQAAWGKTGPTLGRSITKWIGAAALLLLVGGGGLFFVLRRSVPNDPHLAQEPPSALPPAVGVVPGTTVVPVEPAASATAVVAVASALAAPVASASVAPALAAAPASIAVARPAPKPSHPALNKPAVAARPAPEPKAPPEAPKNPLKMKIE